MLHGISIELRVALLSDGATQQFVPVLKALFHENGVSDEFYEGLGRDRATLSDRFGDHGLTSIVVAWPEGDTLRISDWLMSCRALGRGVEQCPMNHIFSRAHDLGLSKVRGEYIPTAKNAMVKDFWAQFRIYAARRLEVGDVFP